MVFNRECVAQVDIFAPTALPTGSLVTHAQSFFSSVAARSTILQHHLEIPWVVGKKLRCVQYVPVCWFPVPLSRRTLFVTVVSQNCAHRIAHFSAEIEGYSDRIPNSHQPKG